MRTVLFLLNAISFFANATLLRADDAIDPFLKRHCAECHAEREASGEFHITSLTREFSKEAVALQWQTVYERVLLGEMPPHEVTPPSEADTKAFLAAIAVELKRAGKEPRSLPAAASVANRMPHDWFFGPHAKRGDSISASPARLWRISPQIYSEIINDLGKNARSEIAGPFAAGPVGQFTDYANAGMIDEPAAAQLIRNASAIVASQMRYKIENGERKYLNVAKEIVAMLDESQEATSDRIAAAIKWEFRQVLKREPTAEELERFSALMAKNLASVGREAGLRATLTAVLLLPEASFRSELGEGTPDELGRVLLSPREIAFALSYALTDRAPDGPLLDAAAKGKLANAAGVREQFDRLWNDPKIEKQRLWRFFREYFGYHEAEAVFKDDKENRDHEARILVSDTDLLIKRIVERDQNVLRELLTTSESYVNYEFDKKKNIVKQRHDKKQIHLAYGLTEWSAEQPMRLDPAQRAGILTQPSWLVANSANTENHAIRRGKWIREKLLGLTVPDLPITVDAKLPEDPAKTLRERMAVTEAAYCAQCHKKMNPLGLPFEAFDHFGRFRSEELGQAVDTSGAITGTGEASLDGEVKSWRDMIERLAASDRVRQVFIRHAFRYWMGRNETPRDTAVLQAADAEYLQSGGSMKALVAAFVTSDTFLYRIPLTDAAKTTFSGKESSP